MSSQEDYLINLLLEQQRTPNLARRMQMEREDLGAYEQWRNNATPAELAGELRMSDRPVERSPVTKVLDVLDAATLGAGVGTLGVKGVKGISQMLRNRALAKKVDPTAAAGYARGADDVGYAPWAKSTDKGTVPHNYGKPFKESPYDSPWMQGGADLVDLPNPANKILSKDAHIDDLLDLLNAPVPSASKRIPTSPNEIMLSNWPKKTPPIK